MKIYLSFLLLFWVTSLFAQSNLIINFNAYDSTTSLAVPLDSVIISDLTTGVDTTIYGASPSLVLLYTGISDKYSGANSLSLSDPYPNPTSGEVSLILRIDQRTDFTLKLYSFSGTTLYERDYVVNPGSYILKVNTGGNERVILSIQTSNRLISRKVLTLRNISEGNADPSISIYGFEEFSVPKNKSTNGFVYNPGDTLMFIAFANAYHLSQIQASPTSNSSFTFSLISDTIFVCGDSLFDTRDSQSYATVKIGSRCWMAENLNVGTMVFSTNFSQVHTDVSNNGMIEKYCYDNDTSYCIIFGGLYDWDEAMGYVTTSGAQGICPAGWHIPTDGEWKLLEGTIDSQYGIGSTEWSNTGWRGFDAGGKLKESGLSHWLSPNTGATNSSGFTSLPGGYRHSYGYFAGEGSDAWFWSSSVYSVTNAWCRNLHYSNQEVARYSGLHSLGRSVRCIHD